jgi:hypothetical protein
MWIGRKFAASSLLSDGEDNRSIGNKQADVLWELQRVDCLFYAINPNGYSYRKNFGRRAQKIWRRWLQTGGAAFVADSVEDLAAFTIGLRRNCRGNTAGITSGNQRRRTIAE